MTKALFKKQMMEVFSWIYRDKKSGKNRSKKGIISYIILYLFVFATLGSVFYIMADALCVPLNEAGLGWLFFAIMGLVSVALGVFGSVFSTYTSLYQAKDNDLLLSMPVPTPKILAVRLFGVYSMGLLYSLIVMIPTLIVYFIHTKVSLIGIINSVLIPFILSLLVLTLSCILGWVVALVAGRLKNKNIAVVFLSLAFIAIYYYVYAKAYAILGEILANAQSLGDKIKSILYPFYHMGLAAYGNALSMFIFTAIIAVIFFAVYLVLSHSFLKLATSNRGTAKAKYKRKASKAGSADSALLYKELKRFLGSPIYMLNCGLGIIFMLIAAVALIIKGADVANLINQLFINNKSLIPLIATAAMCLVSSMNDITSPSVSLEGKNLWLVQSFPVSSWQALKAKLKLHLILTLIPVLILAVCVDIVIKPDVVFAILIPVVSAMFVLLTALMGLFLNLKMPNLNWTDETVPVKQSLSVLLALFGSWAIVIALAALYIAVMKFINPLVYMVCVLVVMAILSALLFRWVKNKGTKIFEAL